MKRTPYEQYSYEVKQTVSRNGDVNLYPNLKIPKSTPAMGLGVGSTRWT